MKEDIVIGGDCAKASRVYTCVPGDVIQLRIPCYSKVTIEIEAAVPDLISLKSKENGVD